MDIEKYKKLKESQIQRQKIIAEKYQQMAAREDPNSSRFEAFQKDADNTLRMMNINERELSFIRPENPEDIKERRRIMSTYAETIAQTISDDHPVFFHGVKSLAYLESILSSGHLGDVDGSSHGMVDVTGRNSIKTTLDEFVGIHESFIKAYPFLPASCMFVLEPKDDQEKTKALIGGVASVTPVDFVQNPEQLVAIVSTTENQDYIKDLCQKYGVATDKVCTFDSFIERMQRENEKTPRRITHSLTDICKEGHEKQEMCLQVIQAKRADNLRK